MELKVILTKVTTQEFINRDNEVVQRSECEGREADYKEGLWCNRVVFTLYGADALKVRQGMTGTVTINIDRKALQKRDGGTFQKNECSVINWRPDETF